jgi:hypothetical protein
MSEHFEKKSFMFLCDLLFFTLVNEQGYRVSILISLKNKQCSDYELFCDVNKTLANTIAPMHNLNIFKFDAGSSP